MNFQEWFNKTYPHPESLPADCYATAYYACKACKKETLKILKQPIQNCDLSWEETDSRFIEKIEKL